MAEHLEHQGPAAGGQSLWGEQSAIPPEVKDLLNEETTALLEEVTWEKLSQYWYTNQTLTVLLACWGPLHSDATQHGQPC